MKKQQLQGMPIWKALEEALNQANNYLVAEALGRLIRSIEPIESGHDELLKAWLSLRERQSIQDSRGVKQHILEQKRKAEASAAARAEKSSQDGISTT